MNKKQMVKALSYKTGMTLAESNEYLNTVLGIMAASLKNGEDVSDLLPEKVVDKIVEVYNSKLDK